MEDGVLTTHGKKLLMVGLFLWFVAVLIGGEDDPGIIAQQVEASDNGMATTAAFEPAQQSAMKVTQGPPPAARRSRQDDAALEAWYASSDAPGEAALQSEPQVPALVEPSPVDESHLINDTQPLVSAAPEIR